MQEVHFIAINDGDSKEQVAYLQSMNITPQGLFDDYYSKDLSKKQSLSNIERMKTVFFPKTLLSDTMPIEENSNINPIRRLPSLFD